MHRRLSLFSPSCCFYVQAPNLIRSLLLFSTSITSPPNFLPSYLVTKCGFSPEKAAEASKHLHRVKSPDQPESVIAFFKSQGFQNPHLAKLFVRNPQWLARDVEKSFAPKVRILHEMGITGCDLLNLVISYPGILNSNIERTFVPKFEFWRRVFGSDKLLMKCLRVGRWLFCKNLESMQRNVSFLQECGLTDRQISLIVSKEPFIISQKPEGLNKLVSRVERLRLPRGSPNFHWALYALAMCREENLNSKIEMMKGFGWSEEDYFAAFRKSPLIARYTLKLTKAKMEFLVKEAGCTASYIALKPVILTYSLEKRIIPRLEVFKALKEKGISCGDLRLATIVFFTPEKFFDRFIAPYKEAFPELSELLSTSC